MRKVFYLSNVEADKIVLATSSKNGMIGKKGDWDNLFAYYRDINGEAYVMMHGTENGDLVFYLNPVNVYEVYRMLCKQEFIRKGEKLHIVCCHGEVVAKKMNAMKSEIDEIWPEWADSYNFDFVNSTPYVAHVSKTLMGNGKVRLVVQTRENKLHNIMYDIANCW
jgi:hypothetical protein